MRCMPHTVHLAAIKVNQYLQLQRTTGFHTYLSPQLLEAIGAISKTDSKKAAARGGNYQDVVSASLSRVNDNEAVALEDQFDEDGEGNSAAGILTSIEKVVFLSMY